MTEKVTPQAALDALKFVGAFPQVIDTPEGVKLRIDMPGKQPLPGSIREALSEKRIRDALIIHLIGEPEFRRREELLEVEARLLRGSALLYEMELAGEGATGKYEQLLTRFLALLARQNELVAGERAA